jgi:hypothetical protein
MFILALLSALSSGEMVQSGRAAGVDYSVSSCVLESIEITSSPTEFSYRSSTLLGQSQLRVSVSMGRLSVDGKDCGVVNLGDKLIISRNCHVTLNGRLVQ